jgi:lambda family phage portal protein
MWQPGSPGPNAAVMANLDILRNRSRESVRNNGWIRKGNNCWVSNEIGTGITPRAVSPDKNFNKSCDALWERWIKEADADRMLDYDGLSALCCRSRREAGEVFVRMRIRDQRDGLSVPLQLQVLEAEFCPINENQFFAPGRRVRAGIEFNGVGKRTAYWMWKTHPGDTFFSADFQQLVRVPADQVLHHGAPLRPGQIRYIPETVQALISAKIFEEFRDAESQRKRDKSSYTGVVRRAAFDENDYQYDPFTGNPLERDKSGVGIQDIEGGSMIQLFPGEDVTMFDGDSSGQGYGEFIRHELLRLFSAMDIPYEYGSGDMSGVNDRTLRAINMQFYRIVEQAQWHLTVPQLSQPIREAFIRMAILAGKLDAPGFDADPEQYFATAWGGQRWQYLHPEQDVNADLMEIRGGLSSRKRKIAERAEASVEEIDQENAEDKERAEKLGLTYDTKDAAATKNPADDDQAPEKKRNRRPRD